MQFLKYWLPVLAWAVLIFYLSGLPSITVATGFWNTLAHYAAHFVIYFIFAILLARAFASEGLKLSKVLWFSFFIAALYALSDEYHQLFVAGRFADLKDVITDWLGNAAGLLMFWKKRNNN